MDYEEDKNGKIKTKMVYVGLLYEVTCPKDKFHRLRIMYVIEAVLLAVLLTGSLCLNTYFSRQLYVNIPYALLLLAAALNGVGVYNLFKAEKKFGRELKEKCFDRLKQCSFVGMLLSFLALAGQVIIVIRSNIFLQPQDYCMLCCTILIFGLWYIGYIKCGKLTIREIPNEIAGEWKDK